MKTTENALRTFSDGIHKIKLIKTNKMGLLFDITQDGINNEKTRIYISNRVMNKLIKIIGNEIFLMKNTKPKSITEFISIIQYKDDVKDETKIGNINVSIHNKEIQVLICIQNELIHKLEFNNEFIKSIL